MAPIDSPGNRLLSRRAALRLAGAAALTLPATPLLAAPLPNIIRVFSSSARQFNGRRDPFTLGVASGALRPNGFVLWTRLAPLSEAQLGGDRDIAYEIAEEPADRADGADGRRQPCLLGQRPLAGLRRHESAAGGDRADRRLDHLARPGL